MICSIMQPTYIPWCGYFDMIDQVDLFILYDDVQLTRPSWQVRNKILGPNGELWLTIPIKKTASLEEILIKDALIDYSRNWNKKHLKSIELNYSRSPHFNEVMDLLSPFYHGQTDLFNLTSGIIIEISNKIGIKTPIKISSELGGFSGTKDDRLVEICKVVNASEYLSPKGSADYINAKTIGGAFPEENIKLYYHNYDPQPYPQASNAFVPYIGIYDLLFNVGFENALEFIRKGRRPNIFFRDFIDA